MGIEKLSGFLNSEGFNDVKIQVDGGITKDNISRVADAGASIFVAGSSAYKGGDINSNVKELKKSALQSGTI